MKKRKAKLPEAAATNYWIKTAGYAAPGDEDSNLWVAPGICRCGHIKDGVAFAHGRNGGWLISYADLMELAENATAARGLRKKRTTEK